MRGLIWRARIAIKELWLRLGGELLEFCHICGREQPTVWHVSDDLWREVTGISDGSGVLCPECFDRMVLRSGGSFLRWTATR